MSGERNVLFTITLGNLANIVIGYAVSYLSFTILVIKYGVVWGLLFSWGLSFIVFYSMFLFYAWFKKDWIGIGKLRSNLEKSTSTDLITKLLKYAHKKGEILFFIVLSIKLGPFTSLIYMRNPNDYGKMQRKDWKIFLIGFLITNLFCTVVVLLGIGLLGKH